MSEDKTNNGIKFSSGPTVEPGKKTIKPSLYKVRLLNDDYTPMEFVSFVVHKFFNKSDAESLSITMLIHNSGSAICGLYTKDVAETKVGIVNDYARKSQHPLKCTLEENS